MSYTLIGSVRSPYVRIVRMLMIQHAIPFEFRVLNFVDDAAAARELEQQSPINRVPILIDGNQKVFDSRVIVRYLMQKHRIETPSIDDENRISCAYSCMDTAVTLFLMRRDGYDMSHAGFYLSRQRQRIPANLGYLSDWTTGLDPARDWNYASMSLYAFLYWANAREILKVESYAVYQTFLQKFSRASGVAETTF